MYFRNITSKISKLLKIFPVVAIIGPRQCGKSTLAQMVCPDWKYFDLERPSDFQLISSDEEFFFQNYPAKIIIDEAQQLPQLFSTLRSVVEIGRASCRERV